MVRTARTPTGGGASSKASSDTGKRKPSAKSATKPAAAKTQPGTAAQGGPSGDAAAKQPTPTNAAPATKSGGGWMVAFIVLCLVGAGLYLTYPKWKHLVAEKLPTLPRIKAEDPRVAGLSERIKLLESKTGEIAAKDETIVRMQEEREKLSAELAKALARLETVEKSMASVRQIAEAASQVDEASAAKESLKRLSDRLAALEGVDAVGKDAAAKALAERLTRLEQEKSAAVPAEQALAGVAKRLDEIERRAAKTGDNAAAGAARAALVLAVGQLREAVQRGGGFQRALDAVKGMAVGDPGIEAALLPLATHAKTGVPTLAMLRDDFAAMASTVVARAHAGDGGWLDKLAARIGALVRVRRTDGAGGNSVDALVARAEKQLAAGDLAAAIAALEGIKSLSPEAAAVAAPWLARAKMRVSAERALAALHIHAVSLLDAVKE